MIENAINSPDRTLLKIMVADGKILEIGTTKMKRYQIVKQKY